MRQENGFDLGCWQAHETQVACTAFTSVDDEQPISRNDGGAGPRPGRVWERRAGTAQGQVQAVGQFQHGIAADVTLGYLLQKQHP